MEYDDASPMCVVTSELKAPGGSSGHYLQGMGAYYGDRTTGHTATACWFLCGDMHRITGKPSTAFDKIFWVDTLWAKDKLIRF